MFDIFCNFNTFMIGIICQLKYYGEIYNFIMILFLAVVYLFRLRVLYWALINDI